MVVGSLRVDLFGGTQMIGRTTELLEAAQEQKRSYEASLGQRQRQITKLDTAFKSASEEVLKVCPLLPPSGLLKRKQRGCKLVIFASFLGE